MAQDSLVKESLTDVMIYAGAELTRKLDELQWPVFASLWLYGSDGNQWKLILASPRVTSDGPNASYKTVQSALAATPAVEGTITLSDIGVTNPENPLIMLLRTTLSTGPTLKGIRFTRNAINGHFVEDAYIYRISDSAPTVQAA